MASSGLWNQLDDLDFADDLALISHTQQQIQETLWQKTPLTLASTSTKGRAWSWRSTPPTHHPSCCKGNCQRRWTTSHTFAASLNKQGGTDADVKARIGKARTAFLQLKNIRSSRDLTIKSKIRVFNTNVKSVLFWNMEEHCNYHQKDTDIYQHICGAFSRSDGPIQSATRNYGSAQAKNRQTKRSSNVAEDG